MPRTRRQRAAAVKEEVSEIRHAVEKEEVEAESSDDEHHEDGMDDEEETVQEFSFNGKTYDTYQDMVNAKRQRNEDVLRSTGLLEASSQFRENVGSSKRKVATARGIKSETKRHRPENLPRRKSSRIAGAKSEGFYVEDERGGRFMIGGAGTSAIKSTNVSYANEDEEDNNDGDENIFNGRVNDGSDLTVSEAVELTGSKWVKENTVATVEHFMSKGLPALVNESNHEKSLRTRSPTSVRSPSVAKTANKKEIFTDQLKSLSLDDPNSVAKVTPDRIYAIACHPSPNHLLVAAGDKRGHLGLWNVDQYGNDRNPEASDSDGAHLLKLHSGAITHLEWNSSGSHLLSAGYDGSVRSFDVVTQKFEEIFATYDDSPQFKNKIGAGMDEGYRYWTQYVTTDHRNSGGDSKCLFLATSTGNVAHIDLRKRKPLSYNVNLSDKKINTVSLHPDGNILAVAGNEATVKLWDVRKFGSNAELEPTSFQNVGRSVNSAFFSPSGSSLLTTTMLNTIDILGDTHLQSGLIKKPTHRIRHDNQTGRWLSTFMARWHPGLDADGEAFVVGSMQKPRTIEIFSGASGKLLRGIRGESLTAVASRCCFHPNSNELIVVGGNSSGRVTIAR